MIDGNMVLLSITLAIVFSIGSLNTSLKRIAAALERLIETNRRGI